MPPRTPITPRFVSSMMSQLPVPWTFFCALYILGMDEATLEQSIQLSSWDQVTDLRKHWWNPKAWELFWKAWATSSVDASPPLTHGWECPWGLLAYSCILKSIQFSKQKYFRTFILLINQSGSCGSEIKLAGMLVSNCWVWDVHESISNATCLLHVLTAWLCNPIMCSCAQSLQSCPALRDPMDLLGSSVLGILQAKILEWVAMSSSKDLPNPGIELVSPASPALPAEFFFFFFFFYSWATEEACVSPLRNFKC